MYAADRNVENCYIKLVFHCNETTDADEKAFKEELLRKGALAVKLDPKNVTVIKQRIKVKENQRVDYLREYVERKVVDLEKEKVYTKGVEVMEAMK